MKKLKEIVTIISWFLLTGGGGVQAKIVYVPADISSIQAAIISAEEGDTVLVNEGHYYENINFNGKAITLASMFLLDGDTSHISTTIIDGSKPENTDKASVVSFVSGEDTTSVLIGFSITGGTGTSLSNRAGGGVIVNGSGAKIEFNKIYNNSIISTNQGVTGAGIDVVNTHDEIVLIRNNEIFGNYLASENRSSLGAGISLYGTAVFFVESNSIRNNVVNGNETVAGGGMSIISATDNYPKTIYLINNYIANNEAFLSSPLFSTSHKAFTCGGGGIYMKGASPQINNTILANNRSTRGGAILIFDFMMGEMIRCRPRLINNTLVNNTATVAGGAIYTSGASPIIKNCIIYGNESPVEASAVSFSNVVPEISFSNIQGGWNGEGNISMDPEFVDNSFTLSDSSPCLDAGDPAEIYDDEESGKGAARNDMGATGGDALLVINSNDIIYALNQKFETRKSILPYRLFVPDSLDKQDNFPMIVYLHGSGGLGSDNKKHIREVGFWAEERVQLQNPCFVLAPQVTGYNSSQIIKIIDSLQVEFPIDPDRIYLTGYSLGGINAWATIKTYPDRFAAVVPIAASVQGKVTDILHMPMWAFHGAKDHTISPTSQRNSMKAYDSYGRTPIYTHLEGEIYKGLPDSTLEDSIDDGATLLFSELPFFGHTILAETCNNPLLVKWLFKQNRANHVYIPVSSENGLITTDSKSLLQNYPNPFRHETTIRYQITENSKVSLKVYDFSGNEVATLVNEHQTSGNHAVSFNSSGLKSGIYLYRLIAGSFQASRNLIVLP